MTLSGADVIKYSSLAVLVIQNCSLILFMRFAMSGDRPRFLKTVSVFFGEIFKCTASLLFVCIQEKSIIKGFRNIYTEFVDNWRDAAKVLVPAAVYTIQNYCLYVAVDNLPAATYMVTYQLKILTTAIFTVTVLKRKLSIQQWVSLVVLFAGVVVVQYDQKMSNDRQKQVEKMAGLLNVTVDDSLENSNSTLEQVVLSTPLTPTKNENSILGFLAVLLACCLSGFAGIYFEKILKGSNVSLWIRNIQLAFPSIFFSLAFALIMNNSDIMTNGFDLPTMARNMLQGFDWATWTTVGISAFGGLVVAVVIKYADNILKAFATSVAIILNCIAAYFLFNFRPTILFAIGAFFVIGAVIVYSFYPYRPSHQPVPTDIEQEMRPLQK